MSHLDVVSAVDQRDFEQLVLCRDPGAGLRSVIAVHDTTLGPSLGGIRMRSYPSHDAAIEDALNLAKTMTYKSALAGLALGGGKSVIDAEPTPRNKARLLPAHARYIASLGGRYIPGVDMGTTPADLDLVNRWVAVVSSRRDPSESTARGVVRAMAAALAWTNVARLDGVRVAVQGLGNVGRHVARMLHAEGARLVVADVRVDRVRTAVDEFGAEVVPVDDVLLADVDVVCPCAAGRVITEAVVDQLKARLVVGAANNVLAAPELASSLASRGIVHVPDFVANAGGVIACEAEIHGDDSALASKVAAIGDTTTTVLERAAANGEDVVRVAVDMAEERLAAKRANRPTFPALPALPARSGTDAERSAR
jgi:leucine dehydrogenase